jgi:hypothetical protein
MRLISLLILVAIVGGIGFVLIFKRDWLFKTVEEGSRLAKGYKAAQTPAEAMDYFLKAVKKRDYKTAATYCTKGDYAEQLNKANDAAESVGTLIDQVVAYMKNKGLKTDKSTVLLYKLDLFPSNFEVKDSPKKIDDAKYVGLYELKDLGITPPNLNEMKSMDVKMLTNALGASLFTTPVAKVEIVQEGKDDDKSWKLNIPVLPGQVQLISHYVDHAPTYVTGLKGFLKEVNNDRFTSPRDFENEVVKVLQNAKQ